MAACQVQCWDFETQQQTEKSISSHASIRVREVCIPDHLRAIMISSCWNVVQAPSYNFVDLFCTLYIVCYASYSHIARCSWWRFSELHRFRIGQALSVISTSRLWCKSSSRHHVCGVMFESLWHVVPKNGVVLWLLILKVYIASWARS